MNQAKQPDEKPVIYNHLMCVDLFFIKIYTVFCIWVLMHKLH